MKVLKYILIIALILLIGITIYKGVGNFKRYKLAEGLADYAKEKGVVVDRDALVKNLNKLSEKEVDSLIKFATAMKEKKFLQVAGQLTSIVPILKKINFLEVIDKISKGK